MSDRTRTKQPSVRAAAPAEEPGCLGGERLPVVAAEPRSANLALSRMLVTPDAAAARGVAAAPPSRHPAVLLAAVASGAVRFPSVGRQPQVSFLDQHRSPTLHPIMKSTLAFVLSLLALPMSAAFAAPAPPSRLADTGLYADFATLEVARENLSFSPQYPLWTDGAKKRRWIYLPEGTAVDASDPDAWEFPVGTKLWKEFAWERPVETRYMELAEDGKWIYATYVWNADGTDAVLAPSRGVRAAYTVEPGLAHDIPGTYDCGACHGGNPSPVLGFSALQLSSDRDPLAPHAEVPPPGAVDLRSLVERGLVVRLPASLVARPPRILAATPRERAALGYLHGNCSSCHNTRGPLADLGFSLQVRLVSGRSQPEALATAVGHGSYYRPSGTAAILRIAPGDPEASVLVRRVSSRNPAQQMPPFGTHAVDETAAALLRGWIREDLTRRRPEDLLVAKNVVPVVTNR
jgi:hypothetical protein